MKNVELFLFGIATVVDVALLLALWERVNRRRVAVWLTGLVTGATLVHAAVFLRILIDDAASSSLLAFDHVLESIIALGLLTLPSAMLHASIRLNHTGLDPYPSQDHRYCWLYFPILLWPLIAITIWYSSANNFIDNVGIWRVAYLAWLTASNGCSILLLLRVRGKRLSDRSDTFTLHLSILLAAITVLATAYGLWSLDTTFESPLRVASTLSPLVAAFLFVWHSTQGRLLPLILERTFVYAAILATLILTHRLFVTPLAGFLRAETGFDFFFVEWIAIAVVVSLVPSLRDRAAGSLRQLFSVNVFHVRQAIREISLKLSQNATREIPVLVRWFAEEVRSSLELEYVTVVLDDEKPSDAPVMTTMRIAANDRSSNDFSDDAYLIHGTLSDTRRVLELGSLDDEAIERAFLRQEVLLAYRVSYRSVTGTVLMGNRIRNDRIARELVEIFALVVDQFAATLHNRREETLRGLAERKILQQEKLSALGLLSGSLAHELRNPLSSIRTISTLVMEELGQGHPCERDLQIVVSEIDRLCCTASRLLEFAKPEHSTQTQINPDQVVSRVVFILEYLARQLDVQLNLNLSCDGVLIASNEASLSEIVFNLVKNAIEAAKEVTLGKVEVRSTQANSCFVLSVRDNGSGIASERRASLFQPFSTYKTDGTGLGLYAVNERVRELGGSIEFSSNTPCGTVFEVSLPMVGHDGHSGS